MLINKIKKCKPIDFDSKLKEYLIKNNDKTSLTENLQTFFSDLAKNKDSMTKMNEVQLTTEEIKGNIDILTKYINQINTIKKKMIFGKDKFCCKLPFDWSDTIKGNHIKSYNINFEVYNSLYNLGILYYCNGLNLAGNESATKEIRRESTNDFKQAIYIFNIIKDEAIKKIDKKELPSDLYEAHLNYCISICEIEGQIQIYKIAKETNPKDFILHSKLLLSLSNLYQKAYEVSCGLKNKKGAIENMEIYYENRAKYFKAAMFMDLKRENKKIFDEKGVKYGEVVFYLNLFIKEMLECQKTINKLGKFLSIESFEKELEEAKAEQKEAEDLNNRIYHQAMPNEEELKFEAKNMMKEKAPTDLYIKDNDYKLKEDPKFAIPELDLLAPKEVRDMIGKYRPKINIFITKSLDQYENEGTIEYFFQNLNIPKKLIKKPINEGEDDDEVIQIPEELWEKINKVQQIGGSIGLNKIMQGIMNKSNYLINSLNNLLHSFEAEDKDDYNCRQKYGPRWMRETSQKLNYQMVQGAQQFIASINQTKEYDQKENDDIVKNSNFFEKLMLPKEKLNEDIPHEEEKVEDTPEEKEIKDEIKKLYELRDKCTSIIRPIFTQLNDDSIIITQFMEVLAKKTTEQMIFERNKNSFQSKFEELKKVSEEVKKEEEVIKDVIKKNNDKILSKSNDNNNNENKKIEYYRNLDQLTNMFMAKYDKIMKGDKYYNDLKVKIDNLIKCGNDWMIKRSNEKNNLIKNMNNLSNSQMYDGSQGYGNN